MSLDQTILYWIQNHTVCDLLDLLMPKLTLLGSGGAIWLLAAGGKHSGWDPRLVLFLKVGFCGGFTTFSTFSLETAQLLQSGKTAQAALYVIVSVVLGIAAVFTAQKCV